MKKTLLGASLLLATGMVTAGDRPFSDRWYFTPSLSFVKPDSNRNSGSDLGLGIAIGKYIRDNISLDLELDNANFDLNNGGELKQTTVSFMGRFYGSEKMGMRPYFGAGFGGMRYSSTGTKSEHDTVANLAVGLVKGLTDNVNLRTELKYRLQNSNKQEVGHDHFDDFIFNAGLNLALGESKTESGQTVLAPQAPAIDSDGDGVSDANDRCPNTPAGTRVDSTGCAVVDGDDDNDGVLNSMDKCPNSPAGAVVDNDGCEVQVVIELQGVHFEFDKANLKPESIRILDAAVKTMGEHGKIRVEVAGHTDSKGTDSYNQSLSERRAKVVYNYLVNKGIAADRMTWRGYGESQPIATNDTEEGRAKNRRTELIVQ